MAKRISEISLADIMPSSIAGDPQVKAMIAALDEELQSLSVDTRDAMIYIRVDELPERVLNVLGWSMHADFWDDRLAARAKRHHIKNSILTHMRKGTRDAIVNGLRMIGAEAEISAWHEYGGETPYHFRVDALVTDDTTGALGDEEVASLVREVIMHTKSERDVLDALRLGILLEDWAYETNDDIREDIELSPLYTLRDEIEHQGQVYGYRYRYTSRTRYGSRRTYGYGASYGGTLGTGRGVYGRSNERLSVLAMTLNGLTDTVVGAMQRYGNAAYGDGDYYGLAVSVVDGGIGLRISRRYRYGIHHKYSEGRPFGHWARCGGSDSIFGGGVIRYGHAEYAELV